MSDTKKETETKKETIYVFESPEDRNLLLDTNVEYEIIEIGKAFLVDAHMHIESLNCTPLQLQWATTFLKTGITMPSDRRSLNGFMSSWAAKQFAVKDFGVIGQYYTDSIGKMYMGRMERNSTRIALDWMAKQESDRETKQNKLQKTHDETTEKKAESLSDFFRCPMVSKYYTTLKPFHMHIAHPMDLCYAHFWGVHRIPMYLKVPGEEQFYFIDDYRKITSVVTNSGGMDGSASFEGYKLVYDFDPLKQGWFEQGGVYKKEHHLLHDFPLEEEFNKFLTYYQSNKEKVDHIVGFDLERIEGLVKDQTLSDAERAEKLNHVFTELEQNYPIREGGNVYHHFLEKVPLDTMEIYEDYTEQIAYYAATAFRFPMRFLPFYHFDPRRHYNETNKGDVIPQLLQKHRFYTIENRWGDEKAQGYRNMPNIVDMKAFDESYFKDLFYEGITYKDFWQEKEWLVQAPYKKDIEEAKYNLFPQEESNEEGKENNKIKFPPHLFWGVKMYPPLGYAPDMYAQAESRYGLSGSSYVHLKEFYTYCEKAQIPITSHGSPLGMSIGDGFNYIKNDRSMKESRSLRGGTANNWYAWIKNDTPEKREEYSRKECALYVDQTNTHALSWKRVIQDFPNLRFCFAHFASSKNWERDYSLAPDLATMTRLLDRHKGKNKHLTIPDDTNETDLQRLSDWRKIISDCITLNNHIFTDISCYVFSPVEKGEKNFLRMQKDSGNVEIREKTGKNIVQAMKSNSALLHKIMMGSDWYMFEITTNGTGEYYKGMFLMLKEMSIQYEGGKYDLWHQFAVINPLRFLGLIPNNPSESKKDENGDAYYELNTTKICRYLDKLGAVAEGSKTYSDWWSYAGISKKEDIETMKLPSLIESYKEGFSDTAKNRIYTSEVMMKRKDINIGCL